MKNCLALIFVFIVANASPGQCQKPAAVTTSGSSWSRDVVPLFKTACIGCHNSESPAGGLNLTSFIALMKGGRNGASIVPLKSGESRLYQMVMGTKQPKMPPGGGMRQLDVDKLKLWIDAGAKEDSAPALPITRKGNSTSGVSFNNLTPKATGKILPIAAAAASLAYSPDGSVLAVGTYREVQFWNAKDLSLTAIWSGHADSVRSIAYSKDGKWLVAGGGTSGAAGEIRVWDVAGKIEVRAFGEEHSDNVNGIAINPDGTKIASASADRTLRIWDRATGKCIMTLRDHADSVWGVAWSPDGKYLASCSADKSWKAWDAVTGKRRYSIGAHDEPVLAVEFSADGTKVVTSGTDKIAKVWGFGPDSSGQQSILGGFNFPVNAATFSPDGHMVAVASGDKNVKLWMDGNNIKTFTEPKDWALCNRFSPDNKHLAAGTFDGQVYVWSLPDGKLAGSFSTLRK